MFKNLLVRSAGITPLRNLVSKFDRVRPTSIIPRKLQVLWRSFPCFFGCSSSTEFDRLRSSSNPITPPRRAEDVNPRILRPSTYHCLKTTLSPLRRRDDPHLIYSKMSKINCRRQVLVFGNPGEPQVVEWALARSKQHLVQTSDPRARNRQSQSDAGEFGFM